MAIVAPKLQKNKMLEKFKLSNGLTVIVEEQHTTPIVAVDIWYKVGSRNEKPGKSGFAHLFEHLMFEGSANVGKNEHMKFISDVGGQVNGSTTQDRTNYWEVVPSNQLELAIWLEADRMASLNVNEENFENQRATVKEERLLRIDNQPYMHALHELRDELIYENYPYKHSVMGSMKDLDDATLSDVQDFHHTYYRPNNAVLSIVGDVQTDAVEELVNKYFGPIAGGSMLPGIDLKEPNSLHEKSLIHKDPFAPFPAVIFSFLVPEMTTDEHLAIQLWEKILFEGETCRFYKKFVEEQALALHVIGGRDGKMGPGVFFGFAQLQPNISMAQFKNVLYEMHENIIKYGVSEAELLKAKNLLVHDMIAKQELVRTRADQFCFFEMLNGQPLSLYHEIEKFENITPDDMMQTANKYMIPENRSIIEIIPKNGKSA